VSRIGKLPVELVDGVSATLAGGEITVKGPKGTLSRKVPPFVKIEMGDKELRVEPASTDRRARAMHGLTRALIFNMVTGVSKGYTRELEINGVGYRAEVRPGVVGLSLGYSHPIEVTLPEGVEAKVDKNKIILSGIDKEAIGQIAAIIRDQRPPEPYKGKGVKYVEETIRRKVGKAGAA
jgi:large subunit ribosomal protein L6